MSLLRVAVPSPLRRLFDYLPPADLPAESVAGLAPGSRLRVPFGRRDVIGILVAVVDETELPQDKLKPAKALLEDSPLIPPTMFALCQWAANYYLHPPGEVFPLALPTRLRGDRPLMPLGEPAWQLSTRGLGLADDALKRSPKQALAIEKLRREGPVSTAALSEAGISRAVLKSLADKQLIKTLNLAPKPVAPIGHQGLDLNTEQELAVVAITQALGEFSCSLLQGVTGSGKTEVYLQGIAACLERGQQALVLIPEIGLTPQTLKRFQLRFDATIVSLHSGLADQEREKAWSLAREGLAHIVIGTRSAVFTPLANCGLVVVDEEHDSSYKQQDGFRYSARDVAIKRAQLEECPVVLGSATPSLESLHNAASGRYHQLVLSQRAGGANLPALQAIDVRGQSLRGGLSPPLEQAVGQALAAGGQVLLFLNRRGYAPTLQCHDCGWIAQCTACESRMTVHRRQRRLRCHHCGAAAALPQQCPSCKSRTLLTNGLGTEQAEETLAAQFPHTPIYRVDSDSMANAGAMQALLDTVASGEPCILVGTQMLSKGHHFPRVTLVGVIDADALLFSADFRGEERMAQMITQVAGRAGRSDDPGRVLLQTHHPDHPMLSALMTQNYAEQAKQLLEMRSENGLPPLGYLFMLRCDSADGAAAEQFLHSVRRAAGNPQGITLIGPLPSALPRRAGKFRFQLMVLANSRASLRQIALALVASAESQPRAGDLRWSIDVDATEVT